MSSKRLLLGMAIGGTIALMAARRMSRQLSRPNSIEARRQIAKRLLASLSENNLSEDKTLVRGLASKGGLLGSANLIFIFSKK